MHDAAPTLTMPEGTDIAAYGASLLQRFSNPALHHRTWQIAMDGSQKLPQRLLGTMQDRLRLGLSIDTHALAVAGWMRYVTAKDEQGRAIDVRDPLAKELAEIAERAGPVAERLCSRAAGGALRFSARSAAIPACAAPSPRRSQNSMPWVHDRRCRRFSRHDWQAGGQATAYSEIGTITSW